MTKDWDNPHPPCPSCGAREGTLHDSKCSELTRADIVNHPAHYQGNGLEAIQVIEAFSLGFHLGNVVKYLLRAGHKVKIDQSPDAEFADIQRAVAEVDDLKKSRWYLDREILNAERRVTFVRDLLGKRESK